MVEFFFSLTLVFISFSLWYLLSLSLDLVYCSSEHISFGLFKAKEKGRLRSRKKNILILNRFSLKKKERYGNHDGHSCFNFSGESLLD